MIANTSYPLLDAFLTILWIFLFVFWIWILVAVVIDIFRSHDMGGVAKALWFLFILFIPLFGVLIYLIARGPGMAERQHHRVAADQREYENWIRTTAGTQQSTADELEKLASLRDRGVISNEEFNQQKARLVGGSSGAPQQH
jgi:hypothetical protein